MFSFPMISVSLICESLRDSRAGTLIGVLMNKEKFKYMLSDNKSSKYYSLLAEYVETVREDMMSYEEEARHLAKLGDMHKAQIILTKKKHAEKEVNYVKIYFFSLDNLPIVSVLGNIILILLTLQGQLKNGRHKWETYIQQLTYMFNVYLLKEIYIFFIAKM